MSLTAVLAVVVFAGAYVLIASEKVNRTAVALGGAALMVVLGVVRGKDVFFSEETGVDWNVIFLLLGMMIIVSILRQTGVFEFVAIWAAQKAKARPFRMMVLLVVITALASALLDNVTTVLLVAPVTLLLCERLALAPVPFLLAEAMASNIGGAATLIGDPPNIIIASRAGLTFNDFLVHLAPIVLVLLVAFVGLAWLLWGRRLRYNGERAEAVMQLTPGETISDHRLLRRMLVVLGLVLLGFLTHSLTHLEPSLVALLGAGAAVLVSRLPSEDFLADVEWETLLFFAGLFVMVGALVNAGVIHELAQSLTDTIGDNYLVASQGVLVGSAVLSGIVDNIPYVATMSPIVHDLVGAGGDLPPGQQSLWWALALGADLGGNATAIGASANVVVTGIARRNEHPISFWTFTKYGLVVTAVTVGLCVPYVWLRYFVLA
ncbi:ArsB/NhaD family transporter [Phycicoccus endophyticus]|uniref:ArsB/NhaD family transporter n=1 Tax=Phycicoccus endophyticus TaxID=1690220 RepID=A0A7G9R139_9MICO|nr:ArsB/NhaD family transporter [Phycicoccus endophyticus]NHI20557.1 ArsB/NhaD family transporter [Phycicoccus endophyticus]QNN49314.1 ArsB/NhaD family transporter [Phycicoccus endophyticus]GGL45131.1 membrane protein [Phycicoccus endophyticus]